ncbi:MarR family winged helix-turn-helix transcriptional regulator [Streptomyces pacificus]|uniref:MarR family transcriptional regulator n=1 Tax=Streptomyces pacificus TaxID=2705029 RepID=A0A6A0B141_9ACTN|nr:MarR family winged helix-turn-helix transcriptional regulator [Streptomyces pacificus]GFH38836.1 MarR family transcriptional regulator [Streptomyces pacificus]
MAGRSHYEELARQLSAMGAVKRRVARALPAECPPGSAAVLALLDRYGEMRISRLAELLAVDMSVTSRHVAHVAGCGWIDRSPDPDDGRSRILRLTPSGVARLDDLSRRTTDLFADCLEDWSDDEVGRLNTLLARLRASVGDCRTAHPPARETTRLSGRQGDKEVHGYDDTGRCAGRPRRE